jgi:hypothetical protein
MRKSREHKGANSGKIKGQFRGTRMGNSREHKWATSGNINEKTNELREREWANP